MQLFLERSLFFGDLFFNGGSHIIHSIKENKRSKKVNKREQGLDKKITKTNDREKNTKQLFATDLNYFYTLKINI